jgi:glutamyl-tRNA synthetase
VVEMRSDGVRIDDRPVRVRFAPAPSGHLHVGNMRTALYNWLLTRHFGGVFVYRVEDTDRTRVTDESVDAAIEILRWLGLDWDEGPGVGGPHAPYRQSERLDIYRDVLEQLHETGSVYNCYCTPEELAARREQATKEGRPPGYDGRCRTLTQAQRSAYDAEGRPFVARFRMPEGSTTWTDLVRGDMTFDHKNVPDFALTRSDGHPLYYLAATVDDVLMGMTHILRGEDLTSATPRQMALYDALELPRDRFPRFGHLPMIVGADGKPLSKRHGETAVEGYRRGGFVPEALINYLALLGWSMDGEHELFSVPELIKHFSVERVSRNPAQFDVKKLEAINGDKLRELHPADLADRIGAFLHAARLVDSPPAPEHDALIHRAIPLVQTRMQRLTESVDLLSFLFCDELVVDPAAAAKVLTSESLPTLEAATKALEGVPTFEAAPIEEALRGALVEGLGLKPRNAFSPVRVAVTGSTVSPPLFESIELLGRDRTLERLRSAIDAARTT